MKMSISGRWLGVLALLCTSTGLAATVTVTPSNPEPNVGESFFVTVSGAGFPPTEGATLGLTFNSAVVSVSGVALAPGSPFSGGVVATMPFDTGNSLSVLGPLSGIQPSGQFAAFRITFTVIAPGDADITLVDNGVDWTWFDDASDPMPVMYNQVKIVTRSLAASDNRATEPQAANQITTNTTTGTPPTTAINPPASVSIEVLLLCVVVAGVVFYLWRIRK